MTTENERELINELRKIWNLQKSLFEFGGKLQGIQEMKEIWEKVAEYSINSFHADGCLIIKCEEDDKLIVAYGRPKLSGLRLRFGGVIKDLVEKGFVSRANIAAQELQNAGLEKLEAKAVLGVPIKLLKRMWGFILIYQRKKNQVFTTIHREIMNMCAMQVATVLSAVRLNEIKWLGHQFDRMIHDYLRRQGESTEAREMVLTQLENVLLATKIDKALDKLRNCSFRLFIERDKEYIWYGTGFFISPNGYALTAYHNLPERMQRAGRGKVKAFYRQMKKPMPLLWRSDLSVKEDEDDGDIAVLQLPDPNAVPFEWVTCAYLPLDETEERRINFWRKRRVFVFGFPIHGSGSAEHLIEGEVPRNQPFGRVTGGYNRNGSPRNWGNRIYIEGDRIEKLEGISGGAVYDFRTGRVVGVEGSYDHDARKVHASELAFVVKKWPKDLIDHIRVLSSERD